MLINIRNINKENTQKKNIKIIKITQKSNKQMGQELKGESTTVETSWAVHTGKDDHPHNNWENENENNKISLFSPQTEKYKKALSFPEFPPK